MILPKESGWSVSATVDAPADRVWRSLLDESGWLSDEDRRVLTRHDGPGPFVVRPPGAREARPEVDGPGRRISNQGEWWYRGALSVDPRGDGSLVVYRVENVAEGAGWWIAQLVQGPQHAREIDGSLQETIDRIKRDRGVSAGPVKQHAQRTRKSKGA